jgi:putative RecB family exonuclease
MVRRIESPSSINTYKQCPRKYFYRYILRLPTRASIHLIRGKIVHSILERFFQINLDQLDPQDFEYGFKSYVLALLAKLWKGNEKDFNRLKMTKAELETYFIDSHTMITSFIEKFSTRLKEKIKQTNDFKSAFKMLTPAIEEEIVNQELNVRGYIDAIHSENEEIVIMDYKTSKKDDMTPEYRLQLGIYALLYKLKHNKTPSRVGINFLKFGEVMIQVDDSLLTEAEKEINFVHKMTEPDQITAYIKKESPLCKWHSGQCDYYSECCKENV